jgi:hypothetical protein
MEKKYEKPVARNLGEMLPNAEGFCLVLGNSANLKPPAINCTPGAGAIGGICSSPGSSATSDPVCQTGVHPVDYGCVDGTLAKLPFACNSGTVPA